MEGKKTKRILKGTIDHNNLSKFLYLYKDIDIELTKMETDKLLPCPFCGSDAELSGMFPHGQYYIQCTGCRVSLWYDRVDKAIGMWNTRKIIKKQKLKNIV